jgi:Ca2+-binding RTX toxin-like protein
MNSRLVTHSLAPTRRIALASLLLSVTLLLGSATTATGAANVTPASKITVSVRPIGANDLKPSQCATLTLTTLVTSPTGTNAADLQLGTPAADNLDGKNGADCIIGGAGDDAINGGGGADICIGGPGTDTFTNCTTSYQ